MSQKNTKRSFRIVAVSHDDDVNFEDGVYHGRGPGQAALKAFTQYCRKSALNACVRRFTIEEITRGSAHKQFHYVGSRRRLRKPKEIIRDGKKYWVHYEATVRKAA